MGNLFTSLNNYLDLTRLNKPIGIWLLFLPCLFGIVLSHKDAQEVAILPIIILFFIGSVIMRSAGCIINDIFDRNFDNKVQRTKERPLASGKISIKRAIILLIVLLLVSLLILLQFNHQTIISGFVILFLVIIYPLTKRFTYYPQIFLGITFNFGILMASTAIIGNITLPIFILYLSSVLWTIFYDTIYAYQDIESDLKIGVKSTAIKFQKDPKKILNYIAISQGIMLVITGFIANLGTPYYILVAIAFFHLLCQVKSCDFKNKKDCLKKFKSNFWTGVIILAALILG